MNKTIDQLFDDLERMDPQDIANRIGDGFHIGRFERDGIIDEKIYYKQKIKVLFISNEANRGKDFKEDVNSKDPFDRRENFRDYKSRKYDDWSGKLRERVSCLYQVITKDFSKKPYEVADCFAFINLNKNGGEIKCDIGHLKNYCKCDVLNEMLKKQISLISPDIIIWLGCNSFDEGIPQLLGAGNDNRIYINDRYVPIVRMWHTSFSRIRNNNRLGKFDNIIVDKQAYKLNCELIKTAFFE